MDGFPVEFINDGDPLLADGQMIIACIFLFAGLSFII